MATTINDPVLKELLSDGSRYTQNANIVTYRGNQMYDIPYFPDEDDSTDQQFLVITSEYQNRFDKISYSYYSNCKYWWIIACMNGFNNPFDIPIDTVMKIPSVSDLLLEGVI